MEKQHYILVVDDNLENLRVVSSHLQEKGYHIALATSGLNALRILEDTKIDLILLDIMMPEMDGFEVCDRIMEDPDLKEIPVIFLTAKNNSEDVVKGFRKGGVDYITKPFNREELLVRVSNHLELKDVRDQLASTAAELKSSRNEYMRIVLELAKQK
jgi:two-component system, sensor histidine kinase and response regulator